MSTQSAGQRRNNSGMEECETKVAGRPRCEIKHQSILDATYEMLNEVGFGALTIEGIAERAGVGKTTIYRRWPNKASLVIDAFLTAIAPEIHFTDTGSVREDLRSQMRRLIRVLNSPCGLIMRSIIAGSQMDEEVAEAFRKNWVEARRVEARKVIKRAIDRGELRRDINPELVLDALYGPLYFRLLVQHQPLTQHFAESLFELVMKGIAA